MHGDPRIDGETETRMLKLKPSSDFHAELEGHIYVADLNVESLLFYAISYVWSPEEDQRAVAQSIVVRPDELSSLKSISGPALPRSSAPAEVLPEEIKPARDLPPVGDWVGLSWKCKGDDERLHTCEFKVGITENCGSALRHLRQKTQGPDNMG
jgi:hypothetical protein